MKDIVTITFKFCPGNILCPIIAPDIKLLVLERAYEENSNGGQIKYFCSMSFKPDYTKNYMIATKGQLFHEIELEVWEKEVIVAGSKIDMNTLGMKDK